MKSILEKKTMSLRINPALYEHIKVVANKENRSLNNYIETALLQVSNYYEPNGETKKAIQQGKEEHSKGILKGYTDIQAMFDEILAKEDE